MAKLRTPRDAWVAAATRALASGGPEAVRVEALAKELGVSKGGFYWHFDDRKALIEETLDAWEKAGTEDVIASVEGGPPDPRARLRRLFELAPRAKGQFAFELALRDWSRRDRSVARRLRRVDARRIGYLRTQFARFCSDEEDVEARALLAYSLFIGSYFVASDHGKRTRGEVLRLAVDRLLDERWD
ncbi:MAG TPA: TetR/AcrR family transcriptional regulator [Solirubrobacterales bacterium]|jgi:AcrR family transcriptional regulator|nr:TetR/AcrR family transcriptional regulator [Solirubrobacterales bacterium]